MATGDYGGMWSSNDDLAKELEEAAKAKGEKIWRMPLAEEYKPNIKSDIADLKNVGGRVRIYGYKNKYTLQKSCRYEAQFDMCVATGGRFNHRRPVLGGIREDDPLGALGHRGPCLESQEGGRHGLRRQDSGAVGPFPLLLIQGGRDGWVLVRATIQCLPTNQNFGEGFFYSILYFRTKQTC